MIVSRFGSTTSMTKLLPENRSSFPRTRSAGSGIDWRKHRSCLASSTSTYVDSGYHVELFLSETQFDRFWEAHRELPLRKIQLRRMKHDGLPHSPCSESDRISADLFMKRSDKDRFLAFIEHHLPDVRFNPGKHSK